jgi:hypothetical protein
MQKALSLLMFLSLPMFALGQNNILTGNVGDYGVAPQSNVVCTLTLLSPQPRLVGGVFVRSQPITNATDGNGAFWFTNIAWGRYNFSIAGAWGTSWLAIVPTNSTGIVPLGGYVYPPGTISLPLPDPATNFYTMTQVDAKLAGAVPTNTAQYAVHLLSGDTVTNLTVSSLLGSMGSSGLTGKTTQDRIEPFIGIPAVGGWTIVVGGHQALNITNNSIMANFPMLAVGTFPDSTFSGDGTGLTNLNGLSGLDVVSSNYQWMANTRPPSLLYGYDPIGAAEAKGGNVTLLLFGDSTAEYRESPAQQIARKFIAKYRYGGWVAGVSLAASPSDMALTTETGPPWTVGDLNGGNGLAGGNGFNDHLFCITNGLVTVSNNVDCPTWGQKWAALSAGGQIAWTNDMVNGVATPNGDMVATKCAIWYTMTNGLGTFKIQVATNGGAFGDATGTINCSQTAGVAQVVTNVTIALSSGPTANSYKMRMIGLTGTTIMNLAGMWDEYHGTKVIQLCLGGWRLKRLFHPEQQSYPYLTPVINNQQSLDNVMSTLPARDLTLVSTVNVDTDDSTTGNSTSTYTNFTQEILYLANEFNRFSASNLTVWITASPMNQNRGWWNTEPMALRTIFNTVSNYSGHDYVYFTGENVTPDRWQFTYGNQNGGDISVWPHWSWAGGQQVANEIWNKLKTFSVSSPDYWKAGTGNNVYTPEAFGAVGDGFADDTIPVNQCEAYVESLIFKGVDAQSQYNPAIRYKMTGPWVFTNRFNIVGRGQTWGGFGGSTKMPTIVSSASPAVQCLATNFSIAGAYIEGISVFSSNSFYNNGAITAGQVGFDFRITNGDFQTINMVRCLSSGFDTAFALTNFNDARIIECQVDNFTNGMMIGIWGPSLAANQGNTIQTLRGNGYGTHLTIDSAGASPQMWSIYDLDISGGVAITNADVVHLRGVNATMINPNIEGQGLTNRAGATNNAHFLVSLDGSKVQVFGGSMNLSSVPTFYCTNNSVIQCHGTLLSSANGLGDGNAYGAVFNQSTENLSLYDQMNEPGSGLGVLVTNTVTGKADTLLENGGAVTAGGQNGSGGINLGSGINSGTTASIYYYINGQQTLNFLNPGTDWRFLNSSFSSVARLNDSQLTLGGGSSANPSLVTTNSGPGIYFYTNNTAANGSLYISAVNNGLAFMRTNGTWKALAISP